MNLLWSRPLPARDGVSDERRVRDYVTAPGGMSESAASLADKLGISRRRCRQFLDELAKQGVVRRQEFATIDPLYCRFPTLVRPTDTGDDHLATEPAEYTGERRGDTPSTADQSDSVGSSSWNATGTVTRSSKSLAHSL